MVPVYGGRKGEGKGGGGKEEEKGREEKRRKEGERYHQ